MTPSLSRRSAASVLSVLAAALLAAACDGSNAFVEGPPTGGPTPDVTAPGVAIEFPVDQTSTVAVGDSVFVRARVTDNQGVDSVTFEGFALRGDPNLGTQTRVERYVKKVVVMPSNRSVRDTTLARYLVATTDALSERDVYVVVTAKDTAGNATSDTARVNVGGPRVSIVSPADGAEFRGGTQIPVRLQAEDPVDLIRSVRLRATGAFTLDTTITLRTAAASLDSTLTLPIPNVAGAVRLEATATAGSNIVGTSRPVDVVILQPAQDVTPPRVTFDFAASDRAETRDSVRVSVTATDETRVDSVGATVLAILRRGADEDTLAVMQGRRQGSSATLAFSLTQLGLTGLDSATVALEVTAYAVDPARNCGAATTPNTPQQLPCVRPGPQGSTLADVPGRLFNVFITRGLTVLRPFPTDVLADLVADSTRLYLSNLTRNRIEILPLGATALGTPVRVGSEPWGLTINRFRDTLYVANSGGTNISAVAIRRPDPIEVEEARIFTRNEVLFDVEFAVDAETNTAAPSRVTRFDYSDRPQFIGQASNGLLVFSTKPTGAAPDGTVRIFDPKKQESEIFIGYVDRTIGTRAIVVNAADAGLVVGKPNLLRVCARTRRGDTAPGPCFTDGVDVVSRALDSLRATPPNALGVRYDTRVDLFKSIADVGFEDTTFVGVSGNRDYVAVGEGAADQARIPMFRATADSLTLVGDVRDLISNTNERVIGLGINFDGSLGVARGNQAYFFLPSLRLQGVSTASGAPTGGVAMHPENVGYPGSRANRVAFISGIEGGQPYIDVIDAFNFFRISRIFLRDPVVGALAVAPRIASDPPQVALRLYAITAGGIVGVEVTQADLGQ